MMSDLYNEDRKEADDDIAQRLDKLQFDDRTSSASPENQEIELNSRVPLREKEKIISSEDHYEPKEGTSSI